MQYILRRKLLHGIYDISKGNQMIDVAMQYGFDTYAGFYKAFKRELGYTPSEFLKKYKVKEPYHINLIKEETIMVTHKRITEILVNWGLQGETVQDIYYEDTGNHNENAYYVGTEYVIKFSSNLGRVVKHIELSEAISKAGLMGATVVKTQDGKDFVEEEALYFYLIKRISGKAMKASDIFQGNYSSDGRVIGEIIGQLHLALQEVDCEVKDVNLLESIQKYLGSYITNFPNKLFIETRIREILLHLKRAGGLLILNFQSEISESLIHVMLQRQYCQKALWRMMPRN